MRNSVLARADQNQSDCCSSLFLQGGTITLSNIGVIGTKDRVWFSDVSSRRHRTKLTSQDPRPILFDGQAVIGATGRTMVLPRYNSKMEAMHANSKAMREGKRDREPQRLAHVSWATAHLLSASFESSLCNCPHSSCPQLVPRQVMNIRWARATELFAILSFTPCRIVRWATTAISTVPRWHVSPIPSNSTWRPLLG